MENNLKVISFSLYGDNPKYTIGLINNIALSPYYYPGWKVYVYYNYTVPKSIINEISSNEFVKLIDMSNSKIPGMFWRFLVNDEDDVELFIVRDSDSRLSLRESIAVHNWILSNKKIHIMRDHPHHTFKILGGMWGMRVSRKNMSDLIINYLNKSGADLKYDIREIDQSFLKDIIYKKYWYSSTIHADYNGYEFWSKKFPSDRVFSNFVGEIFDESDVRTDHYKLL